MKNEIKDVIASVIFFALVVLFLFGVASCNVYLAQEKAEIYNRLCGGHVTTNDAMLVELRVDGNCKQEKK